LIDAGANIDAVYTARYNNERGYNQNTEERALHMIISGKQRGKSEDPKMKTNQLRVLLLLLEAGADVNAVRKELVQEHVEVESPTDDPRDGGFIPSVRCVPRRETPVHQAIRLGRPDIVRMLVSHGANPNSCQYTYGAETKSAHEMAAAAGPEMVEALQCQWAPKHHQLYAAQVRGRIFTALCIAKREKWPLDPELLHLVLYWIASPPFPCLCPVNTQKEEQVARMSARNRIAIG